jgi:hypothetical protein
MSNEAVSISTEALLQLAEGERDHYLRRALEAESQNQALQEALVRCCEVIENDVRQLRREGFEGASWQLDAIRKARAFVTTSDPLGDV